MHSSTQGRTGRHHCGHGGLAPVQAPAPTPTHLQVPAGRRANANFRSRYVRLESHRASREGDGEGYDGGPGPERLERALGIRDRGFRAVWRRSDARVVEEEPAYEAGAEPEEEQGEESDGREGAELLQGIEDLRVRGRLWQISRSPECDVRIAVGWIRFDVHV